MSETAYFLGAGANRGLTNPQGQKPPLDGDFFQLLAAQGEALPNEPIPRGATVPRYKFRLNGNVPSLGQASEPPNILWVYDFIQRFWHISPKDLASKPFSLEELLTFLQLERQEATKSRNDQKAKEYLFIELVLEHRLSYYLSKFSHKAKSNPEMVKFGEVVYKQKSTIITTNYDLIVEAIVDKAFHSKLGASSKQNAPAWSVKDSYPSWFSKGDEWTKKVPSKHTRPLMLKLHGSLNWAAVVDVKANVLKPEKGLRFYLEKEFTGGYNPHRKQERYLYKPLIVPMILYKGEYLGHPAIRATWEKARKELSECQNLVVIGYSFPPTDFNVKKLFLEALYQRELKKLTIVNPDTSVVQRIKNLTHFQKPIIVCNDIGEFLKQL